MKRRSQAAFEVIACGIFVMMAGAAFALPAPLLVKPGRVSPPVQNGVTIGGKAADEFSLIGVSAEHVHGGKGERLTLSYGDRHGHPHRGEPGFFHVALDRDAKRIVIDLAQMRKTAVDANGLAKVLSGSKLVASSDITMDPFDGSTNLTLILKQPVKMKVSSEGNNHSRIVFDLQPVQESR